MRQASFIVVGLAAVSVLLGAGEATGVTEPMTVVYAIEGQQYSATSHTRFLIQDDCE